MAMTGHGQRMSSHTRRSAIQNGKRCLLRPTRWWSNHHWKRLRPLLTGGKGRSKRQPCPCNSWWTVDCLLTSAKPVQSRRVGSIDCLEGVHHRLGVCWLGRRETACKRSLPKGSWQDVTIRLRLAVGKGETVHCLQGTAKKSLGGGGIGTIMTWGALTTRACHAPPPLQQAR